ncbi:MAG: class I SAM-dependent methyltransferase [Proteobacteria bacterium]|nr:class I SAM-dependent methyltransferase [Pseudomonadota bacterium]
MTLKPVCYDDNQHKGYREGRALDPEQMAQWAEVFAAEAPLARPLDVLDLGSGVGRFTPLLAETFGGRAWGVEPSAKMRALADAHAAHQRVAYLEGSGEAIPLPDASVDLVLMFLSFHHMPDRATAAAEIARVLKPGGRVLLRSVFSDRMPELDWHRYFPRARAVEMQMFPTLGEAEQAFATTGFRTLSLHTVEERFAPTLREHARRLRLRAVSTFEHLSEAEIQEGFARLDTALETEAAERPVRALADLLVLGRA